MKKNITVGIIILAIVVITICVGIGSTNKKSNSQNKTNNTAEIVMQTIGSIPYDWEYSIEDTSIVKFKETKETDNNSNSDEMLIGGGNDQIYIFEGIKEGKTTIKFELKSFLDEDIAETKNFDVVVDKDLKITITEKK